MSTTVDRLCHHHMSQPSKHRLCELHSKCDWCVPTPARRFMVWLLAVWSRHATDVCLHTHLQQGCNARLQARLSRQATAAAHYNIGQNERFLFQPACKHHVHCRLGGCVACHFRHQNKWPECSRDDRIFRHCAQVVGVQSNCTAPMHAGAMVCWSGSGIALRCRPFPLSCRIVVPQ